VTETTHHKPPNLLLLGYDDDAALPRPQLAEEWDTTEKSIRSYQYDPENPLPFVMMAGKVHIIVRSAREFIRRREERRNQRHQRRGDR
jgi:hypothetical protein